MLAVHGNVCSHNRMGWVAVLSEVSHPSLRAVISPEERREMISGAEVSHPVCSTCQRASHPSALLFLAPPRRKQLRMNLNQSWSLTVYWYFLLSYINVTQLLTVMQVDSIRH